MWDRLIRNIQILYHLGKRSITDRIINQGKFGLFLILRITYRISNGLIPVVTTAALTIIIYDFGFFPFYFRDTGLYTVLLITLLSFKVLFLIRFFSEWVEIKKFKAHVYSLALVILTFYLYHLADEITSNRVIESSDFLFRKLTLYAGVFFLFFTEASSLLKFLYRRRQNPAFVFILSFVIIIVAGAFLLLLPNATVNGISTVNAFFTSASAVCVTGLTVVNTATDFTTLGKLILLFLIQIGGLGIMTFTGLLGYLAAGSVSFHNQVALKSMVSSNRLSNVITIVGRIILVTLFFEAIGASIVYSVVDEENFSRNLDRIFFSVFHAVSAFCNAGFSTLPDGLNEPLYKFNYSLHTILMVLIVLGGMGFPIVFNVFSFIRAKAVNTFNRLLKNPNRQSVTRIIQVNSKLALATTFSLLVFGFLSYMLFEWSGSLLEHPTLVGKLITSLFGSVTPRTAGFNTVDMTSLTLPTIMIYLLLMWIGASPSSTGGGIKTTTAAVAFLNMRSIVQGKSRTEIFYTRISEQSINRAFAVVLLSLLIIGVGVLLVSIYDGQFELIQIAFEVFSAFSTVGLTLGITPELSETSKIVLMVVMIVGRVGALTILMAFVNQVRQQSYQYPTEEIMF